MLPSALAARLLVHFSPEERAIPDHADYPGRNADVLSAINGALQELYGEGSPWVRLKEIGGWLNPPASGIEVEVTSGSDQAFISGALNWFVGCTIAINGSSIDNRILNAETIQVPDETVLAVSGDTGSAAEMDGLSLIEAGTDVPEANGVMSHSTDGNQTAPEEGDWVFLHWVTSDGWRLQFFRDGEQYALWFLGDGSGGLPNSEPVTLTDWIIIEASPPTTSGVPTLSYGTTGRLGYRLKFPYDGTTGTVSATVYHDCISLPDSVMKVLGPVRMDGIKIGAMVSSSQGLEHRRTDDFGHHRNITAQIDPPGRISERLGRPGGYYVESWLPSDFAAPEVRMRFSTAPLVKTKLEYQAMLKPPAFESLSGSNALPVPLNFVDSLLWPIARQRLTASPFFRDNAGKDEIKRAYDMALKFLKSLRPGASSGIKLRPRH